MIPEDTITFDVPITKAIAADAAPDSTVYVEGLCTDDDLDLDSQIIDRDFAIKGLGTWFADWGNVRVMHSPNLAPAGKAVQMEVRPEGIWVRTHVVEPTAVQLVKAGVYSAYSVGVSQPRVVHDRIAKNGRVVDGIFSEISLVDFPANPRSRFTLAKRAHSGLIEVVEKIVGAPETLADRVRRLQDRELEELVRQARHPNSDIARPALGILINKVGPITAADLVNG
ncbi:hypothetical protein RBS60_11000 [Sinomonas sp. ASV486]|uniref:hypothetical protein n=1 Tax=Sinomonas sp. ASV486 TaxID=3051170 RepID=UPI0027DE2684|nr:hypothetical protein [Sinomonas sp. ASV486]MDQ4490725.1 hypothetical protein [Sinomonas sp. ASV486]